MHTQIAEKNGELQAELAKFQDVVRERDMLAERLKALEESMDPTINQNKRLSEGMEGKSREVSSLQDDLDQMKRAYQKLQTENDLLKHEVGTRPKVGYKLQICGVLETHRMATRSMTTASVTALGSAAVYSTVRLPALALAIGILPSLAIIHCCRRK